MPADDDADEGPTVPLPRGARVKMLAPDLALIEHPIPTARVPAVLTQAERDVALEVFVGATNSEIARARGVSVKTIGNQLEAIYRKLGVASRVELVLQLRHVRVDD